MSKKIDNPMQCKTTQELIKFVESIGYTEKSKNGSSHRIFECQNKPVLSIPNHRELSDGTKRNIAKLVMGDNYYQTKHNARVTVYA